MKKAYPHLYIDGDIINLEDTCNPEREHREDKIKIN